MVVYSSMVDMLICMKYHIYFNYKNLKTCLLNYVGVGCWMSFMKIL